MGYHIETSVIFKQTETDHEPLHNLIKEDWTIAKVVPSEDGNILVTLQKFVDYFI